MADKVADLLVYEMYEVICECDADTEATIAVADSLGWSEEEVQDAIDRHRKTLGKHPFWGDEEVDIEVALQQHDAPEEPITDKVINDMVVYGKVLAGLTVAKAVKRAAQFLNMTEADVLAAIDRHEQSHRK